MQNCSLILAKDGNKVPVIQMGNQSIKLGSLYDGRYAASRWADFYTEERTENVLLYGMGDCQAIIELSKRIPGRIIVFEPLESVFRSMSQTPVYRKVRKNSRVQIFSGERKLSSLENAIGNLLNEDWIDTTRLLVCPGYNRIGGSDFLWQMAQKICDEIGYRKGAIRRFIHAMIPNKIKNLSYMKEGILFEKLKKKWNPDVPVILVCAGPSLIKNVEVLKRAKGHACILAVDAAIPTLLEHGILPDVISCVDATKDLSLFSNTYEIPCLMTANAPWQLAVDRKRNVLWCGGAGYEGKVMEKAGFERPEYFSLLGVATCMLAVLLSLKVKKIVLVGSDLAYSKEGKSHIDGRNEGFVSDETYLVDGYDGQKIQSREDWCLFRQWMERTIAGVPDSVIINATEGGAKIRGTIQMSLEEAVEEMQQISWSMDVWMKDSELRLSEKERERLTAVLEQNKKDLQTAKEQGYTKTFFEWNYIEKPVMRLVIAYMKSLDDASRRLRFEKAIDYVTEIYEREYADGV